MARAIDVKNELFPMYPSRFDDKSDINSNNGIYNIWIYFKMNVLSGTIQTQLNVFLSIYEISILCVVNFRMLCAE